MRRDPLVSIIIPAYNYAAFLPHALDSALAQPRDLCEVVVADDGSTDDTPRVLDAYASRVRVLTQANQGLSAARNAGIEAARGRWLLFLDADDLLFPGAVRSQLDILEGMDETALAVCRSLFFEACDPCGVPIPCGEWRLFRQDLDAHLCHFNIAPPHGFLVRREAVVRAGGFDTGLSACEDHDLWFRLSAAGARVVPNPAVLAAYRRHPGSMSRNLDRQYAHDAMLHRRVAKALLDADFPPGGRLEGLLGCLAGCLLTANRLEGLRPGSSGRLFEVARDLAKRLDDAALSRRPTETAAYFAARTAASLPGTKRLDRDLAMNICRLLERILHDEGADIAAMDARALDHALERMTARLTLTDAG
jgi:glycosyltransferase involved in cell wall biosynthesis